VATSIVDTELPPAFVTNAVVAHCAGGAGCEPAGTAPTTAAAAMHADAMKFTDSLREITPISGQT
jgi:hypothetical protein